MFKYYGNKDLLQKHKIGICGSLYPSDYGHKVTIDFVQKQSKVLVFHDEIGIAQTGIKTAIEHRKDVIVISRKKRIIADNMIDKMLIIYVDETHDNEYYISLFERIIDKLAVIELARSSRLLLMVDNLLDKDVEIYVIPGSIYSTKSTGSNLLIAEGANLLYDELEI